MANADADGQENGGIWLQNLAKKRFVCCPQFATKHAWPLLGHPFYEILRRNGCVVSFWKYEYRWLQNYKYHADLL